MGHPSPPQAGLVPLRPILSLLLGRDALARLVTLLLHLVRDRISLHKYPTPCISHIRTRVYNRLYAIRIPIPPFLTTRIL